MTAPSANQGPRGVAQPGRRVVARCCIGPTRLLAARVLAHVVATSCSVPSRFGPVIYCSGAAHASAALDQSELADQGPTPPRAPRGSQLWQGWWLVQPRGAVRCSVPRLPPSPSLDNTPRRRPALTLPRGKDRIVGDFPEVSRKGALTFIFVHAQEAGTFEDSRTQTTPPRFSGGGLLLDAWERLILILVAHFGGSKDSSAPNTCLLCHVAT